MISLLLLVSGCVEEADPTVWRRTLDLDSMALVDKATFVMGYPDATPSDYGDSWKENEHPPHDVTVNYFYMDVDEVTVRDWAEFLNGIGNAAQAFHHPLQPVEWSGETFAAPADETDRPIRYVSWTEAAAYCDWAGGRLPTEAEWELAAKGPDEHQNMPWSEGSTTCDKAVHFTNHALCADEPQPVGSRSPDGDSPYGITDMAGNVAEWVFDRYGRYDDGDSTDPIGPDEGELRVVRGGGFRDVPASIRTTARYGAAPDKRSEGLGFRCVGQP